MHLSEKTPLVIESARGVVRSGAWKSLKLGVVARVGAAIPAGAQLVMPEITIRAGDVGLITLGPSRRETRNDAVAFEIEWRFSPRNGVRRSQTLLRASLDDVSADEPWTDYRLPLDSVAGSTGCIVIRNTLGWRFWRRLPDLVLYDLAISDEASLDLERARSFREVRIRNELVNMDEHYKHAMFQAAQEGVEPKDAPPAPSEAPAGAPPASPQSPPPAAPAPVISATQYSHEQLYMKVGLKPPLFGSLLKARVDALQATGSAAKVRVLSLCSGGARTELGLVKDLPPERVSVTLFDVNRNLLNVAERTFSSWGPVQTIVGDVNEIDLRGEQFDVVLCVAALHHVVELEHVIESVAEAIGDTGEFWSMAEALGRNGGRMWPESYAVANEYFSRLPEKYRFNRNTSSVDHVLQNIDYSIGCFEGIRCEAIEPTLLKYLDPVHVSKHNCIVWKLFSLAYTDNYDVASEADRKLIETAVDLDAGLHRQGRFGVELHGVYRRKR